jgi:NADH-quinone oxidoreductase subunit N
MSSLVQLSPEIAVIFTVFLVLLTDLFPSHGAADPAAPAGTGSRKSAYALSLLGLLVALGLTEYLTVGLDGNFSASELYPSLSRVLVVDSVALFLKGVVLLLSLMAVGLSSGSFSEEQRHPGEYYLLLLVATLGEMMAISSRELLTFFIAFELLSLPLYMLAGFRRYSSESAEAGVKYFITGAISSAFMLYGISWIYGSLRTTVFTEMPQRYAELTSFPSGLLVGILMMTVAFAFKVSAAPFHNWAPDVYSGAPTTVVAYLSTAPKVAMVGVMLRFYWTMAPGFLVLGSAWLALFCLLALFSMTIGNLCALAQTNLKRMMAYSGVAQIGYLMLGLASCSLPHVSHHGAGFLGISSSLFFVAIYGVSNLGAWAIVGIVERQSGSCQLESMEGLAQRNPYCAFVLAICLMSLAGVPPLAGFFGKFYLFRAIYQTGIPFLVVFGILNSVISLYYYFKVLRAAYFNSASERPAFSLSLVQKLCLTVCLLVCVGLGLDHNLALWTEHIPQPFVMGTVQ